MFVFVVGNGAPIKIDEGITVHLRDGADGRVDFVAQQYLHLRLCSTYLRDPLRPRSIRHLERVSRFQCEIKEYILPLYIHDDLQTTTGVECMRAILIENERLVLSMPLDSSLIATDNTPTHPPNAARVRRRHGEGQFPFLGNPLTLNSPNLADDGTTAECCSPSPPGMKYSTVTSKRWSHPIPPASMRSFVTQPTLWSTKMATRGSPSIPLFSFTSAFVMKLKSRSVNITSGQYRHRCFLQPVSNKPTSTEYVYPCRTHQKI